MRTTKQKSIMENVANYAATGATAIFLLAATGAFGETEENPNIKTQQVFFTATVNGGAAFIPVTWTVTGHNFIENKNLHQFRLTLTPGTYTAKLACNGKTNSETFPVVAAKANIWEIQSTPKSLNITLPCD